MQRVVDTPVGKLIQVLDGGNFEMRYFNGHVYGFSKHYTQMTTPVPTGKWEVSDFGEPWRAKNAYPRLADRIDAVCKP